MDGSLDIWMHFIRTVGMFFIAIGLVGLLLYLAKHFFGASGNLKAGRNLIKVISMHHFSPKEKVVLLEVLDEKILIGITPGRITRLARFDKSSPDQLSAEKVSDRKQPSERTSNVGAFSKILAGQKPFFLNKKQMDNPSEMAGRHEK